MNNLIIFIKLIEYGISYHIISKKQNENRMNIILHNLLIH